MQLNFLNRVNLPGGFHGTLDRQGQPMAPTGKTIVQQVCYLKVPAVQGGGSSAAATPSGGLPVCMHRQAYMYVSAARAAAAAAAAA
jgi:hypothetical protein